MPTYYVTREIDSSGLRYAISIVEAKDSHHALIHVRADEHVVGHRGKLDAFTLQANMDGHPHFVHRGSLERDLTDGERAALGLDEQDAAPS